MLLLFRSPQQSEIAADIVVRAVAGKTVGKFFRFKFRSVHQNDTYLRIGIRLVLVIAGGRKALPAFIGLFDLFGFFLKWIHNFTSCAEYARFTALLYEFFVFN